MIPIILAGGIGDRLWPLSTAARPKQFRKIMFGKTLFACALDRVGCEGAVVVGNARHEGLIRRDFAGEVLFEPVGRNTAAAIALAALRVAALHGGDAVMLICPSDHVFAAPAVFSAALVRGEEAAKAGEIVTFGVAATRADTGYGYIKVSGGAFERFVEKPDKAAAREYVASGDYFWNSGIFMARADVLLVAFAAHAPEVLAAVQAFYADGDEGAWRACPSISFDCAVMEAAENVVCEPLVASGWSDLGSWRALIKHACFWWAR
ncbi:MAG: mannose-1-phosphate guanylyltransferase [Alphaproteobacteria bacterium]